VERNGGKKREREQFCLTKRRLRDTVENPKKQSQCAVGHEKTKWKVLWTEGKTEEAAWSGGWRPCT